MPLIMSGTDLKHIEMGVFLSLFHENIRNRYH